MNELIDNSSNNAAQDSQKEKRKFQIKKGMEPTIAIVLCIVMIFIIVLLLFNTVSVGSKAVAASYTDAYNEQRNVIYQEKYNTYKSSVEEKFHVSNKVSIHVENLREKGTLEVLKVSDVEFVIEDKNSNDGKVISWLMVPGEAGFEVDLKAGEYVVDNERAHVLVRLPYPELTDIKIDFANVQKILFKKDGISNGSYSDGEKLANQQLKQAELLISKEFTSNQNFYLNAQEAAISTMKALVKQLNPEVENLVVDVEFY